MKVYINVGDNGKIEGADTNPFEGFIEVEIDDMMNVFNYKYSDGKLVELTDEGKEQFYPINQEAVQEQMLQDMMAASARNTFLVELPDEEAVKIPLMYGEWNPNGYKYKKGNRFTYNDKFYKVLLDHTSQADWTPDTASSLYVEISDPSVEYPDFKQPTGAHDAYAKGDKVTYNGKHYISTMDNNVWSPDSYPQAWQLVE